MLIIIVSILFILFLAPWIVFWLRINQWEDSEATFNFYFASKNYSIGSEIESGLDSSTLTVRFLLLVLIVEVQRENENINRLQF